MRFLHTLVQLVEFHQDATVGLVEMEGTLHIFKGLLLTVLLVESGKSKVAPNSGEVGVELGRQFPVLNSYVVLSLVVEEATQIVRCAGTFGIDSLGALQCQDVLQSVGEATVGICLLCLLEAGLRLVGIALHRLGIAHIIIGERMLLLDQLQNVDAILP